MVPIDITIIIVLVVAAFLGICIAGFITFNRFLKIESERGKRFRSIHGRPSKNDKKG